MPEKDFISAEGQEGASGKNRFKFPAKSVIGSREFNFFGLIADFYG